MTMEAEQRMMEDVASLRDRLKHDGRNALFTLANGIVLRVRPVPPIYLVALNERFTPPRPPRRIIHQDGVEDWDEENPNDPDWQAEVQEMGRRQRDAISGLILGMGTEVVSVPEGMWPPDNDAWIALVKRAEKFTGQTIPIDVSDDDMRYLSWLRFYALDNNVDAAFVSMLPSELGPVREDEIAAAVAAFRGDAAPGADPGHPAAAANSNGHSINRAARRQR